MTQTTDLSFDKIIDLIYYNLAHYQEYYKKTYIPISKIKSTEEYLNTFANLMLDEAQYVKEKLAFFFHIMNTETNQVKKFKAERAISLINNSISYNPQQIAGNPYLAKQYAKKTLAASSFTIKVVPQSQYARPYDSAGQINLFASNNLLTEELTESLESDFRLIKSFGPLFNNAIIGQKTSQESASLILSRKKPGKQVNHQIWVTDTVMIQANFKTNKALNDYMNEHPDLFDELMFMVSVTQNIVNKAGNNLTQEFMDTEFERENLENTKRENEHKLEPYMLLAVELFDQLIAKLKQQAQMHNHSGLFGNINHLPRVVRHFSKEDIEDMRSYRTLRNNIAHPMEYNLRPSLSTDLFDNFVPNMVRYLSKLTNISEQTINQKIKAVEIEDCYNIRSLILLMDAKKILEKTCKKMANLQPEETNVFLKLNILTEEENTFLNEADHLRKILCHHKISSELAHKASKMKGVLSEIITKIADAVEEKYQLTPQDYYGNETKLETRTASDIYRMFPALFYLIDKDAPLLKENTSKETTKETLSKLFCFACTVNAVMFEKENFAQNPYFDRQDISLAMREVTQNSRQMDKNDTNRQKVFKIIAAKYMKDGYLPRQKDTPER